MQKTFKLLIFFTKQYIFYDVIYILGQRDVISMFWRLKAFVSLGMYTLLRIASISRVIP